MYNLPNLTPFFYLAIFGLICAVILALGGIGFAVWFVVNHVQIVW